MAAYIPIWPFHTIEESCDVILVSPQVFLQVITGLYQHRYLVDELT